MSQKVVIKNPCRLSYPHLFQPKEGMNGGAPKYGATVLIPKSDVETIQMVNSAIQAEYAAATQPNGAWKGSRPPQPTITLYDGDQPQPRSGEPWGDECKGCYILRTSSASKPDVVDGNGNKAMDATMFYAGCYCYYGISFAAYDSNGNKGIGAFLNTVMFAKDGDPLEAHASATDDFADIIAARRTAPVPGSSAPAAPAAVPSFGGFAMPAAPAAPAAPAQPAAPSFGGFQMPAAPAAPQTQMPMGLGGFAIPGQQ